VDSGPTTPVALGTNFGTLWNTSDRDFFTHKRRPKPAAWTHRFSTG
jgi:hypothetical protein